MTPTLTRRVEDFESTLFYSVAHGDYAVSMTVMVDGAFHAGLDLWTHDKSPSTRQQVADISLLHCNILNDMASCDGSFMAGKMLYARLQGGGTGRVPDDTVLDALAAEWNYTFNKEE